MAELILVPPEPRGGKPSGATPYKANSQKFIRTQADVSDLPVRQEPEPEAQKGVDLSGQTKIVFAAGRGKTGKTTLLRWIAETSLHNGGNPHPGRCRSQQRRLLLLIRQCRPFRYRHAGRVVTWLQELIEHCRRQALRHHRSWRGRYHTRTLAAEMPGLAEQIEASGLSPVIFHLLGTQPEDLAPAVTLTARGFAPKAQALVFNEYPSSPA